MTIQDAIKKLRVMLNANEEVVTEVKMAEATLIDGTVVYTEGELEVGAVLYVAVEEGEAPFAPAGMHETTEGLLVTVGENGIIEAIEEKAVEAEPVVEEASEPKATEELLSAIVGIVKPYQEEIKSLKEELSTLTERFNSVAGEPAAAPVKRNFSADAASTKAVEEARLERLVQLRKKK